MSAVAEPASSPPTECRNCGFRGYGHYCQACGQAYATHRLSLHELLHEVFHLFTHLDKGFLYTLKELARHPGHVQAAYLAGRRVRYQKPFAAFFVAATINALAMYGLKVAVLKLHGVADDEQDFFRHYFVLLQLGLLPLYALLTWLFFRRERFNYAEMGVIVLYSLTFVLLAILPIGAVKLLFPHFETGFAELPLIWGYNLLTNLFLFRHGPRWLIVGKSLLLNAACFALAQLAADALVKLLE